MFHPVGHQPPSVYWRRRLTLICSVAVLLVLVVVTVRAVTSGGGDAAAAADRTSSTPAPPPTTPAGTSSAPRSTTAAHVAGSTHGGRKSGAKTSSKASTSAPPPTPACTTAKLSLAAVVGQATYRIGDKPVVQLQVTNPGPTPCVQDLSDSQIELKVYNGESRVWGSHDCQIQPGKILRTLPVGSPVLIRVTWSGYTSQPKCAGTRQRVGAGTYTLYASLAGRTGKAAQFAIG